MFQTLLFGHKTNLLEANIVGVGSEALTAHVESVLANQSMTVGTDTAETHQQQLTNKCIHASRPYNVTGHNITSKLHLYIK